MTSPSGLPRHTSGLPRNASGLPRAAEEGDSFGADLERATRFVGFALRATQRRRGLGLSVLAATLALAGLAVLVMPKMYQVETRILTNKNYVIGTLVAGRRVLPDMADSPTRSAVELMKARQTLQHLVDEADLAQSWHETRSPVGRIKDLVRHTLLGTPSDAAFNEALLEVLDDLLIPYVDGNVVVLRVDWHHPETTLRIAEAAKQRFLDMKREAELSEVNETVRILQEKAAASQAELEAAGLEVTRVAGGDSQKPLPMKTVRVERTVAPDEETIAERQKIEAELTRVQMLAGTLDREYRSRLEEAQKTLAGLRQTLGPGHPDIQAAVRVVEERSQAPDDLNRLRVREAELNQTLADLGGVGPRTQYDTIRVPDEAAMQRRGETQVDPEVETAMSTLEERIRRHNQVLARLDAAKTERITSQAAFDYRYIVTMPPLLPKRHVKPKVPFILAAALLAGLLLALLAAVGADVLSRRVVEPWQIEQETGIPVLGVVRVGGDEDSADQSAA
jgi:uncharacterized protein involved in exopolysaccharide biosynthesis